MLKRIRKAVTSFFSKGLFERLNYPICRIAEIDISSQKVLLHVRHKAIFIKATFSEAISDGAIIGNVSPWEACWLGGHFGRALRANQEGRGALKKAKKLSYLLSANGGRYRVVFEDREGRIGYLDTKTGREFVEHSVTIATNDMIINRFNPSQACYIGILAGIRMERAIASDGKSGGSNAIKILNVPPRLRSVD